MSELNHRFQAGRMNKDLDERLVPNGEYRNALNVEVASSEGSNIGTLQTIMGNVGLSKSAIDPMGILNGYCIASITDEKNDKLYWFIAGDGKDIIAEYDYMTGDVNPVVVDIFNPGTPATSKSSRVLNFDRFYLVTGINIIGGVLFWTDNNTEPKRVHIERAKQGSFAGGFNNHTLFVQRNTSTTSQSITYSTLGEITQEHLTVIKKSPSTAPTLEMFNSTREDINNSGGERGLIRTTLKLDEQHYFQDCDLFIDSTTGLYHTNEFRVDFGGNEAPDYRVGDFIIISYEDGEGNETKIRATITLGPFTNNNFNFHIKILSGTPGLICDDPQGVFDVMLEKEASLFQFKFPRFGYRYKYEDGEYSTFSPFTEVAFLPGKFDYFPKEGYNLGMVNNLQGLAVKNFVHQRLLPDDVIAIDILYKESNSPNIYSVKTIKRNNSGTGKWNQISATETKASYTPINQYPTYGNRLINADGGLYSSGYCAIDSEMIHAVLPSNQSLRPWDNVPRKALAQEVVGNRLVYANYLQNYNLTNSDTYRSFPQGGVGSLQASNSIAVNVKLGLTTRTVGDLYAEQINPLYASFDSTNGFGPAKSIKTLRTYQLGVVYIDEFGRETPVFSGNNPLSSTRISKDSANLESKLQAQILSTPPEWAKSFKFFIKETSNEYYNLALDRWYNAEDSNIWLSFPSSERNKIDIETFLILKKEHNSSIFVDSPAKYKILAIENEAPLFIKTERNSLGEFIDNKSYTNGTNAMPLLGYSTATYLTPGVTTFYLDQRGFEALGWASPTKDPATTYATSLPNIGTGPGEEGIFYLKDPSQFQIRAKVPGVGFSNYYTVKAVEWKEPASTTPHNKGWYAITVTKPFGQDMAITNPGIVFADRADLVELQLLTNKEKNKAEFEGRFFAKIKKDFTLIKTVIEPSSSLFVQQHTVTNSMPVQYIDPNAPPPTAGNNTDWDWFNIGDAGYPHCSLTEDQPINSNITPTNANTNPRGQTFWDLASSGGESIYGGTTYGTSSGWFIDKIEGFRRYNYTKKFYWNNSDMTTKHAGMKVNWALNTSLGNQQGGFYPLRHFEGSTGYKQMQVIGTNTEGAEGNTFNYLSISGTNNKGPGTALRDDTDIIGSVGIDTTSSIIHLSYSGIGIDEPKNSPGCGAKPDWGLEMVGHVADLLFITELTTPGALWRWKEDPDQIIYRTQGRSGGGYNFDEWSANTVDTHDNNPGIGLYNYVKIADYPIEDHYFHEYEGNSIGGCPWQTHHGHTMMASQNHMSNRYQCYWAPGWAIVDMKNYDEANPPHAYYDSRLNWQASASGWPTGGNSAPKHQYPMVNDSWHIKNNRRRRYMFRAVPQIDPTAALGSVGNSQYLPTNDPWAEPHFDESGTKLASLTANPSAPIPNTPAPGIRPDGMFSGAHEPSGATWAGTGSDSIPPMRMANSAGGPHSPPAGSVTWQIVTPYELEAERAQSTNPSVWETEPKEDVGLDIYHEVGQIYPITLDRNNIEQFIGPLSPILNRNPKVTCYDPSVGTNIALTTGSINLDFTNDIRVEAVVNGNVILTDVEGIPLFGSDGYLLGTQAVSQIAPIRNNVLEFTRSDGSVTRATVKNTPVSFNRYDCINGTCTPVDVGQFNSVQDCVNNSACENSSSEYELDPYVHNHEVTLPWFNCYSFGNGVESDRIRDDYNQVKIDKGPIVSTVLEEPYAEERRSSGLIYSGIYNSMSGINNLNQFIQAEKITKDLNPQYGSIQKLHTRDTNLVTLCEDKIFKILANKDALYNADGNAQLIATENVLGQTIPFTGEFGISTNPESFASESYRAYFTDKARGTVLRLSQDGITPISAHGMKDFFADNLDKATRMIGSVDDKKQDYNLTIDFQEFSAPVEATLAHILASTEYPCYWNLPNAPPGVPTVGSIYPPGCQNYGALIFPTTIRINKSIPVTVGDNVIGSGIPAGTTVTNIYTGLNDGHPPTPQLPLSLHHIEAENIYRDIEIDSIPALLSTEVVLEKNEIAPGPIFAIDLYGHPINISIAPSIAYVPIEPFTVSFSELSRGWSSFKSWHQENGISLNNRYYTFGGPIALGSTPKEGGHLWEHHKNEVRNNFYDDQYDSSVRVLFNEAPGIVKSFQTINYEGTQSRITQDIGDPSVSFGDGEYWDNIGKSGWYVDELYTNLQEGDIHEFKDKEGKWFSQVKGVTTEWDHINGIWAGNIDTQEFSYQGIDDAITIESPPEGFTSWDCDVDASTGVGVCIEVPGQGGSYVDKFSCINDTNAPCANINPDLYSCSNNGYCEADPTCIGTNCWGTESECVDASACTWMPHWCDGGYCWADPDCLYSSMAGVDCYEGTVAAPGIPGESGEVECIRLSTCTWTNSHWCNPNTGLCEPNSLGPYANYPACVAAGPPCYPTVDPHECIAGSCTSNGCDPNTNPNCYDNYPACYNAGCGIPDEWSCTPVAMGGSGVCVVDPTCSGGPFCYIDEPTCQQHSPCPPPPTTSYDCIVNSGVPTCTLRQDLLGTSPDLMHCSLYGYNGGPCQATSPCDISLNPVVATTTILQDPTVNVNTGLCQNNGAIDISVICTNNGSTSWSVDIFDSSSTEVYSSSIQSGNSNIQIGPATWVHNGVTYGLEDGAYTYIITDNQGCSGTYYFNMGCTPTNNPDTFECVSNNCINIVWPAVGSFTTLTACQLSPCPYVPPGPSWDCPNGGGSCYDPGTGNGLWHSGNGGLAACDAACGPYTPTYDCISGACIDPYDGSGYYNDPVSAWNNCQGACPTGPPATWDCPANYSGCYDPGTGNGAYTDEAFCNAHCNSPGPSWDCPVGGGACYDPGTGNGFYGSESICNIYCGIQTWNCDPSTGICSDPGGGTGLYTMLNGGLSACQAACGSGGPCTPPDPSPSTSITTIDPSPPNCNDGGAKVILTSFNGGPATSWGIEWYTVSGGTNTFLWRDEDALGNLTMWSVGQTSSDPGANGIPMLSTPITYMYRVILDTGCSFDYYFSMNCLSTGSCSNFDGSISLQFLQDIVPCSTAPCTPATDPNCVTIPGAIEATITGAHYNGVPTTGPFEMSVFDARAWMNNGFSFGGLTHTGLATNLIIGQPQPYHQIYPDIHGPLWGGTGTFSDPFVIRVVDMSTGCEFPYADWSISCSATGQQYGCTDPTACNYDPLATINDGSCCCVSALMPGPYTTDDFSTASPPCVCGCTDPLASNYDPLATCDDGCVYGNTGCTDPAACNYNPSATIDDGSCCYITGCTDPIAYNFDDTAGCPSAPCMTQSTWDGYSACDDGSCQYCVWGCTQAGAVNYYAGASCDDNSCIYNACQSPFSPDPFITDLSSCQDLENHLLTTLGSGQYNPCQTQIALPQACIDLQTFNSGIHYNDPIKFDCSSGTANYGYAFGCWNPNNQATPPVPCGYPYIPSQNIIWDHATQAWVSTTTLVPDTSCCPAIYGCTDPIALNYDPLATVDDGSCTYCIYGCTDPLALNYYAGATCDDGSCMYIPIYGCTSCISGNAAYPYNCNYDPAATVDDGSCIQPNGCMNPLATNYDAAATCDDGTCNLTCTTAINTLPFSDGFESGDFVAGNWSSSHNRAAGRPQVMGAWASTYGGLHSPISGSYSLRFQGGKPPFMSSWIGSSSNTTYTQAFTNNYRHHSQVETCIDLTTTLATTTLTLDYNSRSHYTGQSNSTHNYSWFRVLVDGVAIPISSSTNSYANGNLGVHHNHPMLPLYGGSSSMNSGDTLSYDLTPYQGTVVKITLQAACKNGVCGVYAAARDAVWIDNISII